MRRHDTERSDEGKRSVRIQSGGAVLNGELIIPPGAGGVVLFAHSGGNDCNSSRNQYVASVIREAGIGTMLFNLMTAEEEALDMCARHLRFDIYLLAERLVGATKWINKESDWLKNQTGAMRLSAGYFGASIGAAAAMVAAARLGENISAVVSRGGRPDLAGEALPLVKAPTLLIAGGADELGIELNKEAFARLRFEKELKIVPGATQLFEEPGALEQAARLATEWFKKRLHTHPLTHAASGR